ncbi:hypothetical protein LXL04_007905 [Taraxacum kok-saghyz]
MKRKGDSGSPCLNPLSIANSFVGDPLTSTDALAEPKQPLIHILHLLPYPNCSSMDWRYSQLIELKALSKSTLNKRSFFFVFFAHEQSSFTMSVSFKPVPLPKYHADTNHKFSFISNQASFNQIGFKTGSRRQIGKQRPPTLAIPQLMRLLMDEAWDVTSRRTRPAMTTVSLVSLLSWVDWIKLEDKLMRMRRSNTSKCTELIDFLDLDESVLIPKTGLFPEPDSKAADVVEKSSNDQNAPTIYSKPDTSKTLPQDPKPSDEHLSPSLEVKKESLSIAITNPSAVRKITGKPSTKQEKPRHSNTDNTTFCCPVTIFSISHPMLQPLIREENVTDQVPVQNATRVETKDTQGNDDDELEKDATDAVDRWSSELSKLNHITKKTEEHISKVGPNHSHIIRSHTHELRTVYKLIYKDAYTFLWENLDKEDTENVQGKMSHTQTRWRKRLRVERHVNITTTTTKQT